MIVTDSGWGVERVFYTAYGEPEVFPFGDPLWPAAAFTCRGNPRAALPSI